MTPLSSPPPPRISLWLRLVPVLVLFASLTATWTAWQSNRVYQLEELNTAFEYQAREVFNKISQRMDAYQQVLRGVQGLFAVSEAVTYSEFQNYVSMLRLDENYPGFQGISYAHYLEDSTKAGRLATLQGLGYPRNALYPAGVRPAYAPVIAIAPLTNKNRRVLGYDTLAEPMRRSALERARDLGTAAVTSKIRLMQENGTHHQAGCLMFLPVFRRNLPTTTFLERRKALEGWIAASFRMDDLMTGIMGDRSKELDIEIFDGTQLTSESLMYDDDSVVHALTRASSLFQSRRQLEIGGQIWTIVVSSRDTVLQKQGYQRGNLLAAAGIGVSLLLTLITQLLVAGRIRAIRTAQAAAVSAQALKEAERLALIGHFDYDPRSNITFWSEGLERIWGFPPDNRPRTFEEFLATVHPEDLQIILDSDADKSWRETSSEFRIIRKDGEIRHIYSHGYRTVDRDGTIVRVFGINQDISDRKQTEDAIVNSRNYYLQLLEHFPTLIWRAGTDGNCNYFNQTWLAFTGRSLEQELGDGWTSGVHPEDLPDCLSTYYAAFMKQEPFEMEYRLKRYDGVYQWITDHGRPYFNEAGQFSGYIGSCYNIDAQKQAEFALKQAHDQLEHRIIARTSELSLANSQLRQEIAERKRVEEELRASRSLLDKAQQQARLGCWNWEIANDRVTWSDELYHLFGIDLQQPAPAYAEHHRLFTPESYHRLDHAIAHALATGDAAKLNLDLEIIRSDGSRRHCLGHGEVIRNGQGEITHLSGTLQDITEYKELERQLFDARRLEAIGQLVGGVAHEVRNPLNAILTVTEALFREKEIEGNPEFRPYLQHIKEQVNRLAHLMNDLLDLGKPIPHTNLQIAPLAELCEEAATLWPVSSGQTNRIVKRENRMDASPHVSCDCIKLQQAIFNLLDNAAQNSPAESELQIRMEATCGSRYACIQIIDAGSGIPPEQLERVFEPFYSNRRGGTGLGLALVKHYLASMGGTAEIRNNTGSPGCTAEICIPIVQYKEPA